jgi:ribonuclease Z
MALESKILGVPGLDNALYLKVDTGQKVHQLLFDCGECGLYHLGKAILQEIDHVFFSHCHMDHICGFDGLFRHLYSRPYPLHIWGPEGMIDIMHCRFRGFTWNLVARCPGEMIVHEIRQSGIHSARFLCRERFAKKRPLASRPFEGTVLDHPDYTIRAVILDHAVDCLAYAVEEPVRTNINAETMRSLGLKPGRWCQALKDPSLPGDMQIDTGDREIPLHTLQNRLLESTPGMKVVYVTDIDMNADNRRKLLPFTRNADALVMECTYMPEDTDLARKNRHLTVAETARLARDTSVRKLVLFHVSDRYGRRDLFRMLDEAKKIHPESVFPPHWKIGTGS